MVPFPVNPGSLLPTYPKEVRSSISALTVAFDNLRILTNPNS
jgi:hypothetical protein